jgi:purine nucleoside permease
MEDTGSLCALKRLSAANRIDFNRILVLRTASNYDSPPPGITAAQNLAAENGTGDGSDLSALAESVEAAWLIGSPVLHKLIK